MHDDVLIASIREYMIGRWVRFGAGKVNKMTFTVDYTELANYLSIKHILAKYFNALLDR